MAANPHEPPPLDDILDDVDPRRLMELLNNYRDAATAEAAGIRLEKLIKSNPDKFFLKLAVIFESSNTYETRKDMLTHLHIFLMRNLSDINSETCETIKKILLDKVKSEKYVEIEEALCNIIADVASKFEVWSELVEFIDGSLNINSVGNDKNLRHEKVSLDIIFKHPQAIITDARGRHEAISISFYKLLSSDDHDTRILAVKAAIKLVGCLTETRCRNPYKKLIPKFIPVLKYMAMEPGPKKQKSVVGHNQKLVDRYVEAADLFQILTDMDDVGFFVTDQKHVTTFIKCLLKIGWTKLCWLRLRCMCLKLAAKFCKDARIDMRPYLLDIYKILVNMMIEVEDLQESDKWYNLAGDDVQGLNSDYTAAKALLDEFIPAIGVQAFLTSLYTRMELDLDSGEWHLQNGVLVIVTKLAFRLKIENEGGRAQQYIILDNLLRLAKKQISNAKERAEAGKKLSVEAANKLMRSHHRLQWTWANALVIVGNLIKEVHPSMIKKCF